MTVNKNTFCVAPWYNLFVESDKKIAPCCVYKEKKYDFGDLEKYFESEEIKKLRHDLLSGVKNKNCNQCWQEEKNGNDSLRKILNRTVGSAANVDINRQLKEPKVSAINSFDFTLGNLCNLKCVMCGPDRSSQLLAEAENNPELSARYIRQYSQNEFNWAQNDDFIQWCRQYIPNAKHLAFSGGEPLIIPWIPDALNHIPDQHKTDCILHFTSNLTVINEKVLNQFSKFKEVWISVSVEGTADTFEYIRYGHKWQKLKDNLSTIRDKKMPNLILKVNHVVQATSFHSILDMTKYFDSQKISIQPILLDSPEYFGLTSLTKKSKQLFIQDTDNYKGHNTKFIDFVRSVAELDLEQDISHRREMVNHLRAIDKSRNTDFGKIIPRENLF